MRSKILWAGVCVLLGLSGPVAWAQGSSTTLEDRLAALERRVELLEKENDRLKAQLSRLSDNAAPQLASLAVASLKPSIASVGPPLGPEPLPERGASPVPSPGPSQQPPTAKAQAPSQTAPEAKPERIQVGGQIRFRAEVRQNGDLNSQLSDLRDFIGQRIRSHVRGKLSDTVETYVEVQDSRLWGQETSPTANDRLTDLHQGYLQVSDFLRRGLTLRAGRQELAYGSERLVGALDWDNVGRSFDAVKMRYSSQSWWSDAFAAKVIDRRSTARGERDQYLYGLFNQFFSHRPRHLEVYGFLFRDGLRSPGEIASRGRKATEIMTLGFRSDKNVEPGVSYELEFAGQFGHRGFDSHRAHALAAKAYKTVESKHQLRLGFEYDMASGDRDPADGHSGEFLNLFPTNHKYYGYADLMGWRNMQDFRPMFTVAAGPQMKFDIDYHRLYLLAARGPWKDAGGNVLGFDPAGQSGTHVGDELDFTVWFPIHKYVKIQSGYSLFVPGEFVRHTRGTDRQSFLYLQTLVDL